MASYPAPDQALLGDGDRTVVIGYAPRIPRSTRCS